MSGQIRSLSSRKLDEVEALLERTPFTSRQEMPASARLTLATPDAAIVQQPYTRRDQENS